MGQKRRKWSAAEKLAVLADMERSGATEASRLHDVSTNMIYRWKSKYDEHGAAGFEKRGNGLNQEKKNLEREIERLRQVVADQALTIRIKDELLKKTRYR